MKTNRKTKAKMAKRHLPNKTSKQKKMTRKAMTKPENFKSPPKEKTEKGKIMPPVKKVITK